MKKRIASLALVFTLLLSSSPALGHSGRTDGSGGHRDNKNKSGLGSYHYHCGGNPAHLHKNGVCPYKTTKSSSVSSNTSTTKSNNTTVVKAAQEKLNKLGYDCGKADGNLGPKTKEAVKKFQKDKGLEVDGNLGPITRKALGM